MDQQWMYQLRQLIIERLSKTDNITHKTLNDLKALARLPHLNNLNAYIAFVSRCNLHESMAKKAASIALDAVVNIPDVIPVLRDMLTGDNWRKRMTASLALAQLNDVESMYAIADLLLNCDPTKTTARAYLEALKGLGWKPGTDAEKFRVYFLEEDWDGIVEMKSRAVPFFRQYVLVEPQKLKDINLSVHVLNKHLLEAATRIPTLEMLQCLLQIHAVAAKNNLPIELIEDTLVEVLNAIPNLSPAAGEAVTA